MILLIFMDSTSVLFDVNFIRGLCFFVVPHFCKFGPDINDSLSARNVFENMVYIVFITQSHEDRFFFV